MQMTFDITSISLRRVYLSIGKFCERYFAGCAIDLRGVVNFASGLSNHCPQQNMSARREASGVFLLMATLSLSYALRILFLYRVLYVFNVLAHTCSAVSFPL